MNFKEIAFLVGIFGDLILQIWVKIQGNVVGLKSYFIQHGKIESLLLAGGLMVFVISIFELTNLKINYFNLWMYGGFIDLLMREFRLLPSLDEYYSVLDYFQSWVLGGLPMILPLVIKNIIMHP